MIPQEKLNNIHKLKPEEILQIMHECAEALGAVSVENYCKIMVEKKRTTYQKIKDGKIKYFKLGSHKYPCINY